MLTLQSFDSKPSAGPGCSDVYEISDSSDVYEISDSSDVYEISDSSSDDTTNDTSSSAPPIIPTENLLTSNSAIPLDGKQLLFLYDCETTGGSHYDEHIIEIASIVIVPDNLSFTKTEFTSLCHTSRCIHSKSK